MKAAKKGQVTSLFNKEKKEIGIDNMGLSVIDERVGMVVKMELKIGEKVTYRQLAQGPDKNKINFIAREGEDEQPDPEPVKETEKVPEEKKEPVVIIAKYLTRTGSKVTLVTEKGEETFDADITVLKIIADSGKVSQQNTYRWLMGTNQKGDQIIKNVGPAKEEEKFRTAKELLQENLDRKRAEDAAATKKREDDVGDQRMKENDMYARNLAAERQTKDQEMAIEAPGAVATHDTTKPAEYAQETAMVPVHGAPGAVTKTYTEDEILLVRNIAARNCTEPEFKLLMYLAKTYGLDPLAKQIWAVKRNDRDPALIFAGRDGFLAIAHRSGFFDGMQSGVTYEVDKDNKKHPVSAWAKVWRKDMSHAFETEVPFSEYNTGYSVWKTNPSAMILKVAESVCLRKAFSIDGIYSPEEINTEQDKS